MLLRYLRAHCLSQGTKAHKGNKKYYVCICSLVSLTRTACAHKYHCERLGPSACAAYHCIGIVSIVRHSAMQKRRDDGARAKLIYQGHHEARSTHTSSVSAD